MDKGNKRLAVVVGCNYKNLQDRYQLNGCINDAIVMRGLLLERFGFDPDHVKLLIDASESEVKPTFANIMAALRKMVGEATAGDVLFFHFSGHGIKLPTSEEAIWPCDLNPITDTDLRDLIKRLPVGVNFTILSDSCHSGGLIDKKKEIIGPSRVRAMTPPAHHRVKALSLEQVFECLKSEIASNNNQGTAEPVDVSRIGFLLLGLYGNDVSLKFQPQFQPLGIPRALPRSLTEDEGILLSGCQDDEQSQDLDGTEELSGGKACGAFTNAVQLVFRDNPGPLSNRELVMKTREILRNQGFVQHPCLYCSHGNADAPFLGDPTTLPQA